MTGPHNCPWCGKAAPKNTETFFNPGKTDAEKRDWKPELATNGRIVSRAYSYAWDDWIGGEDRTRPLHTYKVGVWDGESYRFGASDPFCNSNHAWRFAMLAYANGFRRKTR